MRIGVMTRYKSSYRVETARLRDRDYRSRGWYFVTICTNAIGAREAK
ncbi:MAG TPA: hypothetical protein VNY29_20295 [Terriglobales bacterium]|jgi:hypothetical protein|nr:hypothetical protein [Terriglobales bacterium]